jgi:hypothetical protein
MPDGNCSTQISDLILRSNPMKRIFNLQVWRRGKRAQYALSDSFFHLVLKRNVTRRRNLVVGILEIRFNFGINSCSHAIEVSAVSWGPAKSRSFHSKIVRSTNWLLPRHNLISASSSFDTIRAEHFPLGARSTKKPFTGYFGTRFEVSTHFMRAR